MGYHEMSSQGTPLGKVFAGLDFANGFSWSVTHSHELLEMLANPWINSCAIGTHSRIYALEVCDSVAADASGYEIDSVVVSDFIRLHGFRRPKPIVWTSSGTSGDGSISRPADIFRFLTRLVG